MPDKIEEKVEKVIGEARKLEPSELEDKVMSNKNISASLRQRRTFLDYVGKRGKSLAQSMKNGGFSDAYASNPQQLKEKKSWQELLELYLPQADLLGIHCDLLNKNQVIAKNNSETGEVEIIDTGQLDTQAVTRGLDMAHKLYGNYKPEKTEHSFGEVKDDKLKQLLAEKLAEMMK